MNSNRKSSNYNNNRRRSISSNNNKIIRTKNDLKYNYDYLKYLKFSSIYIYVYLNLFKVYINTNLIKTNFNIQKPN